MADIPTLSHDIQEMVMKLIKERDQLRIRLTYAEQTIQELSSQNEEYEGMQIKSDADRALREIDQPPSTKRLLRTKNKENNKVKEGNWTEWIRGTWLSVDVNKDKLGEAEAAFAHNEDQKAIGMLDTMLIREDMVNRDRIEARLLKSAILRSNEHHNKALVEANKALALALDRKYPDLTGKAQFHRGLCYLHMEKYGDASWCLALATFTKGHTEQVRANKDHVDEKIKQLSTDDPRRISSLADGLGPLRVD
ncbi:MAG: hypothetical protein M1827_002403 [Pycnora praestabilis]|nr:MAG: hypothetical protein M1827_002403 [Pycnora praestabilis]